MFSNTLEEIIVGQRSLDIVTHRYVIKNDR